jgi:hypothetical protein
MAQPTIQIPFSNEIIRNNVITKVNQTKSGICIYVEPQIQETYERSDCKEPVRVKPYHRSRWVLARGLGIPGQAVNYRVRRVRCRYVNDAGEVKTFTLDVAGVNTKLKMTDELVDKVLYFLIDRNESLAAAVQLLRDIYGVKSSIPALHRVKQSQAEKLPGQGELIRLLHHQQPITDLHIDEYKAKGTRGWELVIRDQHGRLVLSLYLKKRSGRKLKAVLRWLRMLGIEVKVCYVDFWAAYASAIRAIYPQAKIQYDYFHILQNIWRHLYREFTAYRKAFKTAKTDKERQKLRAEMHKRLWDNRYLFFTHEHNLSDEEKVTLEQLLAEHEGTILHQIVAFIRRIWDLFNNSRSQLAAHLKRLDLVAEGWAHKSEHFGKVMDFLREHFNQMITYIGDEEVQRFSLAETTVRQVRRIETVRQGFKSKQGRANHFKLFQWRIYLASAA